ncbi:hypothetical protein AB0395_22205 [Streptosporangium sp. NPDC051023]|uniref:hypothetical protein n=1 Tax=Streptosporangium sp. NPDC051023 TaxID=3155410 RepID=UPI00344D247A
MIEKILADKDAATDLLVSTIRQQIELRRGKVTTVDGVCMANWDGDLMAAIHATWDGAPMIRTHVDITRWMTEMVPYMREAGRVRTLRSNGTTTTYCVTWAAPDPEPSTDDTGPRDAPVAQEAGKAAPPAPAPASTSAPAVKDERMATCPECGYHDKAYSVQIHLNKLPVGGHPRDGHYPCPHCPAVIVYCKAYVQHLRRLHAAQYAGKSVCLHCPDMPWFLSRGDYNRHAADVHGKAGVGIPRLELDTAAPRPAPAQPRPRETAPTPVRSVASAPAVVAATLADGALTVSPTLRGTIAAPPPEHTGRLDLTAAAGTIVEIMGRFTKQEAIIAAQTEQIAERDEKIADLAQRLEARDRILGQMKELMESAR